jgi:membrane associated rhomboid family serine protease
VEDHLGPFLFVPFYLLLGVAGMAAHYFADPGSTVPIIGASGAIAGLMGAYLVLWPRARILTYIPLLLFVVLYLPAGVVLGIWFGMQFFTNPNEGVAWLAHVGGFGAGIVLGFGIRAVLPPNRRGPLPVSR